MVIKIQTDEEYHGGEGVSNSTLTKLINKSPFHSRYEAYKAQHHFDIGKAAHIAILEPERLEDAVMCGPIDRRGNKWKEAEDMAEHFGKILLVEKDYETALLIRDLSMTIPELELMRRDPDHMIETAAYHEDEETGMLTKCKPDFYSPSLSAILDIKNMADASPDGFRSSVGRFGYHMQDAMYSDVWAKGSGMQVDVFFFLVFEKSSPPCYAFYELTPSAKNEGYEMYRLALKKYAECHENNHWPAYGDGIRKLNLKKWDYKATIPPADMAEEELEAISEDSEGEANV